MTEATPEAVNAIGMPDNYRSPPTLTAKRG
jgi:hypothetical protein